MAGHGSGVLVASAAVAATLGVGQLRHEAAARVVALCERSRVVWSAPRHERERPTQQSRVRSRERVPSGVVTGVGVGVGAVVAARVDVDVDVVEVSYGVEQVVADGFGNVVTLAHR